MAETPERSPRLVARGYFQAAPLDRLEAEDVFLVQVWVGSGETQRSFALSPKAARELGDELKAAAQEADNRQAGRIARTS